MSGLTLDETVAMAADACQVGWVDAAAAVAVLRDTLHLSSGLCLRLLVDELRRRRGTPLPSFEDRKSTRLNSSHVKISYAVFCLKKKKNNMITLHLS